MSINLFDIVFVFVLLCCVFLFLSHLHQVAKEREIQKMREREKFLYERLFAELGIDMPNSVVLANSTATKRRFGIGWIILCVLVGIWLALLLRPWIIILLSIGPKEFIKMLFL